MSTRDGVMEDTGRRVAEWTRDGRVGRRWRRRRMSTWMVCDMSQIQWRRGSTKDLVLGGELLKFSLQTLIVGH